MDEFFLQTRSLMQERKYKLAEEAYRKLFDILEMGQEPGHLPGDPDYENMLEVDMNEQLALLFRAVYINSTSEERMDLLYDTMSEYRYLTHKVKLRNIIDVLDTPMPDFEIFLSEWIDFLKKESGMHVSELLREVVFLKGGIPAISDFARQYADRYPNAYIDWITALETKNDVSSMLHAAREGLSRIPREYTVRAEVAETISKTGRKLGDKQLELEGYRECFYSKPSIVYFLDLYNTTIECGCFEKVRDEVEQRIMELLNKNRICINNYRSGEQSTSFASEGILANALLLGGRYEKVFEMCKDKGPLGWSSSENPKPILVMFIMTVLSKRGIYSREIYRQWDEAIKNTSFYLNNEYIEKYRKAADHVKAAIVLTSEQEEFYLKWCINEIGYRIDAIVGNQHRGSYHKAAGLLIAMAETLANRGQKQEGMDLIEKYKSKYPRHTAFKSEVTRAIQISGL